MAKFDLKFLDLENNKTWIKTEKEEFQSDEYIYIELYDADSERYNIISLDKSTAIKFAKTLRTEINKIES